MRLPTLIASSIECVTKRIVIIVLLQVAVKRSQEASTPEHTSPERARSGSRHLITAIQARNAERDALLATVAAAEGTVNTV